MVVEPGSGRLGGLGRSDTEKIINMVEVSLVVGLTGFIHDFVVQQVTTISIVICLVVILRFLVLVHHLLFESGSIICKLFHICVVPIKHGLKVIRVRCFGRGIVSINFIGEVSNEFSQFVSSVI